MMHLDTHVLAWLYAGALERFPAGARARLEQEMLAISPIALLELQYLFEIGRLTQPAQVVLDELRARLGLGISSATLAEVVAVALSLSWTRDPFDRLIAGQALAEGAPLLTADRTIREHLELAVWDQ